MGQTKNKKEYKYAAVPGTERKISLAADPQLETQIDLIRGSTLPKAAKDAAIAALEAQRSDGAFQIVLMAPTEYGTMNGAKNSAIKVTGGPFGWRGLFLPLSQAQALVSNSAALAEAIKYYTAKAAE